MDTMKWLLSIGLIAVLVIAAYAVGAQIVKSPSGASYPNQDTLYQVSTIDALAQGGFDGTEPVANLEKYGDFGIGTFDALDGELVMTNGRVYQIRSDGKVYVPGPDTTVPFALVTTFNPDMVIPVEKNVNFSEFTGLVSNKFPSKNMVYAIRAHGIFPAVTVRSVPAQKKPYPTLAEAAQNQSVFSCRNAEGTIIGYYIPDFMKGLNMPGYHLHFISNDRTCGGHVLEVAVPAGTAAELDLTPSITTMLPNTTMFYGADLSRDMSSDLSRVER